MASLMAVILVHDAVTKDMFPNRIVLLSPSLAEVHSAFLTVAWRVNAGQTVWLLGLAATGFLLLVAGNRRARLLALLPVVLSAAVAVPLLPASHDRDYVIDKAATALVCEGPVCVTRLHERELAAIAGPEGPAEEALRLLAALPDPPSTVRETVPVWPPGVWQPQAPPQPAGFVPVDFEARALSGAPKDEVLRGLLAGAGTAPCVVPLRTYPTEEEEQRYDETKAVREVAARTVAAAWFLGDLKPLRGTGPLGAGAGKLAGPAWETLRALPHGRAARADRGAADGRAELRGRSADGAGGGRPEVRDMTPGDGPESREHPSPQGRWRGASGGRCSTRGPGRSPSRSPPCSSVPSSYGRSPGAGHPAIRGWWPCC